ncbi:MAG: hypothetical protein WBG46_10665 [Nonlabens sp.]
MRVFSVFIFSVFCFQFLKAKCGASGIYAFNNDTEITVDGQIIIEGCFESQKTIQSFCFNELYLISKNNQAVPLILQEINVGQFHLTQAVFRPAFDLQTGTSYSLRFIEMGAFAKAEKPWSYTNDIEHINSHNFKTEDEIDNSKNENTILEYEYVNSSFVPMGCGPEVHATFTINGSMDEISGFRTEVCDLNDGDSVSYILETWEGKIEVGHGMCAGAFDFEVDNDYQVRFTPLLKSGKPLNTSKWFEIENPFDDTMYALTKNSSKGK